MKSKELIRWLQEEDPTGEGEVVVGNDDIHFLEWKPGYWDGKYTVLIRDESKRPYYDIVGAEYRSDGEKLCIRTMSWQDVISNDTDAPVKVVDTFCEKRMQNNVDAWRAEMKAMEKELNEEFVERVKSKLKDGWKIRQPSHERVGKYFVTKWFKKGFFKDKEENFVQGECEAVLKSGLFDHYREGDFIYWKLK